MTIFALFLILINVMFFLFLTYWYNKASLQTNLRTYGYYQENLALHNQLHMIQTEHQRQIVALEREVQQLNNILAQKEKNRLYHLQKKEKKIEISSDILKNPSDYYYSRHSCMNYDEASVFYYISHALDKIITNPNERKKYFVFPQYALHSIIKVNSSLDSKCKSHEIATHNFIARSIDFIICYHTSKQNNKTNYIYHSYLPVFAFELDGPSHSSSDTYGDEAFERTKKGDEIKNVIFQSLSIPLIRYTPIYVDIKFNPNKYNYPQNHQPKRIINDDYVAIEEKIQSILS